MRTVQSIIKDNDENISAAALVNKFKRALCSADYSNLINSDLRLSRMQAYLAVIHSYNAIESIEKLHDQVIKLNQFRSTFNYKPSGFDLMVDELEHAFLIVCLDSGMGTHQLKELSYSFNLDDLKAHELMHLRN